MTRFRRPAWFTTILGLSLAVAGPCVGQCPVDSTVQGRHLMYAFDPTVTDTTTVLHVTVSFLGNSTGTDELEVPSHWAGQTMAAMTNLRPISRDAAISEGPTADTRRLRYPPNQPVVIAYDLRKDWAGPLVAPMQFHPVIMPTYLEINGDNGLVFPKLDDDASVVTVDFDWQRLPPSWALATSFGTGAGAAGRCQSYSGVWRGVHDALFAAGDFRIHQFLIGRRSAVLAVRGQWTFTDEDAITDIQRVVGIVRDFWHDDAFPYFLVTLKPYDRDGTSDGSAFTNAFWLYMPPTAAFTTQLTQLSHEAFHAWDPRKMGTLTEAADSLIGWFHEGCTQYYAYLLVYRAHLMSLATYVDDVNRDLRDFPSSSSPYVRGRVIALWLDGQIREESHGSRSLDDVMFDMVRGADAPLTQARILETAGRYLSAASRAELARMVQPASREPTSFANALVPCVRVTIDSLPTFDIGFDVATSRAAKLVSGVVRSGAAYQAGLRDGQTITGISVYNGQPDKLAKITVLADTGRITVSYYPLGKAIRVPQLHVDETAYGSNPEACHTH